jgi:pimeloyl-ACP methyl ester carboxylesterase
MTIRNFAAMAACALVGSVGAVATQAQAQSPAGSAAAKPVVVAKNVVLVHGVWADGASWGEVIAILQAAGLHVTAVQNSLTSLSAAVADTRRVLAQQDGPTVLVGDSWSGTLISETGDDPKVSALVYIAARAPDAGEDSVAPSGKFPTPPARAGIEAHDGYTKLSEDAFLKHFANGVPRNQARVLYAEQGPAAVSLFADKTTVAAWHDKPSFYAVAQQDKTISRDFERFLAKRMNATIIEVDAGHLSMVSKPQQIADLILAAAGVKR